MTRDEEPASDGHGARGSPTPSAPETSSFGSNDVGLLAALRGMWQRRDPVPVGLVESVLARIAGFDLDVEYEMLTLVESTERLAGVRGSAEARNLTFASQAATVMLRVSELPGGRRRLDGWVSPPAVLSVVLTCAGVQLQTSSDANGRFELADVPAGTADLSLRGPEPGGAVELDPSRGPALGTHGEAGPEQVRLKTPLFTL